MLGLCFAALTVYCCFAPISAAADVVGDYIRCIPCVGETLEDLLEGMVDALLCAVSCAFLAILHLQLMYANVNKGF